MKTTTNSYRSARAFAGRLILATSLAFALAAGGLRASTVYWDADADPAGNDAGSGAGLGGTGVWDASLLNWFDGVSSDAAWSDGNDAVFTGTGGTVTVDAAITAQSISFTNASSSYEITNSSGGSITLNSAIDTGGGDHSISAPIGGFAGLTKNGAGVLTLGGANNYSGPTFVTAGTLQLGSANNRIPDESAVTVAAGATFDLNTRNDTVGSLAGEGVVNFAGTERLVAGGDNTDTTWAGTITGGGGLTKNGAGVMTLTTPNSYSGRTIINAGTLSMSGNDNRLGTAPASHVGNQLTLNGGTLRKTGVGTTTLNANRGISLGANGGTFEPTGGELISGAIVSGAGSLTKIGPGTLRLTGDNTMSGPVFVNAGVLRINSYAALGSGVTNDVVIDGGTVLNTSTTAGATFISVYRPVIIGTNGASFDIPSGGISFYVGVISGSNNTLTKIGSGEFRTYDTHHTFGKLAISDGIYCAGTSSYDGFNDCYGAIPEETTADAITIRNGAEMRLAGGANVTLDAKQGITIGEGGGQITSVSPRTFTVMGSIQGGTNWLETGDGDTGTVSLRGANQLGPITNSTGVLIVRNSDALGDTAYNTTVNSGSCLAVSTTVNVPEPLLLFGTGTASSTGALRNNGNNNIWSGPITLGESGVRIDSAQASLTLSGGVSGDNDPNLLIGGAGNVAISTNQLNLGAGTLTKDGTGTLTLDTANVIGSVVVSAGTLVANAPGATGSGSVTVNAGATLGGSGTVDGAVTLDAGASIGAGTSTGILTLNNGANLSAGATNVWELAADSTAAAGVDFDQLVLTGGDLALGAGSTLALKFIDAATSPDLTNAFWQAARQWPIISLTGSAANPGDSNFSMIDGTNGITAGTFTTTSDATGVTLVYAPGVVLPTPVTSMTMGPVTGGFCSLTYSGGTGAQFVLVESENVAAALASWTRVDTNTAASGSFTIPVGTDPKRFYRIISE